jgi:thiamine-phosphate pyrophosphorylase
MWKNAAEPSTMAEVKPRCRLYLQFPAQLSAKLDAQLAEALASADAACVLLSRDEAKVDETEVGRLIDLVQCRGVACLIEDDAELAERLGADGVHLDVADPDAYTEARSLLGASASMGAGCGLGRHDAMRLAEMGADYVAFGASETSIDAIDQVADLIAWWAEIFVVPCVAWNIDRIGDAERLASLGADFVAPSTHIWKDASAPRVITEMASAISHVRRAA